MLVLVVIIGGFFEFHGQATGQTGIGESLGHLTATADVEYRPGVECGFTTPVGKLNIITSVRAVIAGAIGAERTGCQEEIAPYRMFLSYGKQRYEVRVGLQQINFGSAMVLRPLRWFDRIDPRDPIQTTAGVYSVLCRYYFGNNDAWLWVLLGNTKPKGLELTPTPKWLPEAGGRLELALPKGEMGGCFHHRWTIVLDDTVGEEKFGLDARWDIGPGGWFEGALVYTAGRWQEQMMVGTDYTLALGNGLTVFAEHLSTHAAGVWRNRSVLSLNYLLGLNDNLNQLTFLDWEERKPYIYLTWQHNLDSWRFILTGYFNGNGKTKGVAGRIIFNH